MACACELKPVVTGDQFDAPQTIILPDQETLVLGRSPLTGIIDKKLSRQHVEVTADYSSKTIKVKQIGPNPACFQGKELDKGQTIQLSSEDKLQLLTGKYELRVKFPSKDGVKENGDSSKTLSYKLNAKSAETKDAKVLSSAKKRPLMTDGDEADNDVVKDGNDKPAMKKSKRGDDDVDDDIDQKLAALQHQAKEAEQKRDTKKLETSSKMIAAASPKVSTNGPCGSDASRSKGEVTPAAQAGTPSTEEVWREEGKLIVFKSIGVKAGSKMVGFDMDGTLITTASGKVFPQNADDWKFAFPEVPGKLKKLHAAGYKIVIFTNQLGVSKGKLKPKDLRRKITNLQRKMGVPFQAFAATAGGLYRKPAPGMWDYILSKENDGIKIDVKASMFVGDAAGRPADWGPKKKKDFSCSDRLFAINVGLPFKTPEEFFLGQKPAKFNMPAFDPRSVSTSTPLFSPPSTTVPAPVQEVLILVGFPASGKSTFVKQRLLQHKYVHVNRDTMGTWQKCVSACSMALGKGQSVVIDNTNGDIESRKRYVDCAKKAGVQCRCLTFSATFEQARHNEKFRRLTPAGKNHASISDVIFYSFRKSFVPPKKEEGYADIAQVNFVPSFNNAGEEKLYRTFLMEK